MTQADASRAYNCSVSEQADPGFRDLDRSAAFDEIVSSMEHFDTDAQIRAVRRASYRLMLARPGANCSMPAVAPASTLPRWLRR